jgi:DNA-directed RNA polymerase specialized sigma24 family protein
MSTRATGCFEAARRGDPVALGTLMRQRHTQVVRYAMRLCISPADAEYATQEALIARSRYIGSRYAPRRACRASSFAPAGLVSSFTRRTS